MNSECYFLALGIIDAVHIAMEANTLNKKASKKVIECVSFSLAFIASI